MPNKIGNNKIDDDDTTAININNSGKNPLVPGNPTFAREAINKYVQKIGITANNPLYANIDYGLWWLYEGTWRPRTQHDYHATVGRAAAHSAGSCGPI